MHLRNEAVKKLLGSTYFYSFFSKSMHIIFGFIGTIIINRFLGAELKGEYAYITNIIALLIIVGNLGIYQSYPFNTRKNLQNVRFLYVNLIVKQFLVYLLLIIIFNIIFFYFGHANITKMVLLIISTLLLLFSIFSHQILMIASVECFKDKSIILIIAEFIKLILLFMMYFSLDRNLVVVLLINVLYHFMICIFCYIKLNVIIDFKYHNLNFVWDTIKQGFFPTLFTLLLSLNYSIDILFLRISGYVSLKDVGLYSVGVQLATYVWVIPDIFKEVLFSKTAKDDSLKEITYCIKISLFIEALILFFIIILGRPILILLYGIEYAEAILVTQIIFIGVLSMTLFKLLTPLYNAKGKYFENFIILFISVVINVILNYLLIPPYGNLGAAVASVVGYTICGFVYLIRFKREYKLSIKSLIFINKSDIRLFMSLLFNKHNKN